MQWFSLLQAFGLLVIGFTILIYGSDLLVKTSVSLALRLKVSPAIIGLTIVALGTSAPELITTLIATYKNAPDIALGNVVGSNIFNILAIVGIACLLRPNKVNQQILNFDFPVLLLCTGLFLWIAWNGQVSRLEGGLFALGLVAYIVSTIWLSRRKGNPPSPDLEASSRGLIHDVSFLGLGFIALLGGAHLALEGGVWMGTLFGLSERIIGVTIISVGTGLPELATSAVAAYKGRTDLALANVIGSNIANTLGIVGMAALLTPLAASPQIVQKDSIWMMAGTLAVFILILLGRKHTLGRMAGGLCALTYVVYIGFLIFD